MSPRSHICLKALYNLYNIRKLMRSSVDDEYFPETHHMMDISQCSICFQRGRSVWGRKTKNGTASQEQYDFLIHSNSDVTTWNQPEPEGSDFFSSHHSARGNESTSTANRDVSAVRFCTLIHTPGASDYHQVGGTNCNTA